MSLANQGQRARVTRLLTQFVRSRLRAIDGEAGTDSGVPSSGLYANGNAPLLIVLTRHGWSWQAEGRRDALAQKIEALFIWEGA